MKTISDTSHVLEISGPRNIAWRPADRDKLGEACKLADEGRLQEALNRAADDYIAQKGDMHGVSFRVVTTERRVSFIGAVSPEFWTS
jgi:hypothetical protein